MAERKIVSVAGNIATFEISVKDRDEQVKAMFQACKDAESFKAFIAGATAEVTAEAWERYIYGVDLKARAAARESVAVESTIVKRDGKSIDIMTLPVERAVGAINAAYAEVAMLGGKPGGAFSASRRKLLEAGKCVEVNGVLTVKK